MDFWFGDHPTLKRLWVAYNAHKGRLNIFLKMCIWKQPKTTNLKYLKATKTYLQARKTNQDSASTVALSSVANYGFNELWSNILNCTQKPTGNQCNSQSRGCTRHKTAVHATLHWASCSFQVIFKGSFF